MQRQENNHSSKRNRIEAKPLQASQPRFRLNKPASTTSRPAARAEHSAGGVVFRRAGRRVLLGLIKDSYRKWTLPKGHLEKGESPAQAALRETHEEMGLKRLRLVAPLGCIAISFKDRYEHVGQTIHKRIDFFLMETAAHEQGVPERAERIAAIRWVPYREAVRYAGYKNIQPILRQAASLIDRELGMAKKQRPNIKN